MKNTIYMFILIVCAAITANAQAVSFNSPVNESTNLTCKLIKPLSVSPNFSQDFLNWPTVPVGQKYVMTGNINDESSDILTIFIFSGEPNASIEISVTTQTYKDNVEISYRLKGTQNPYLGLKFVPVLGFIDGKSTVNLNNSGDYYLHIVYDWVWAHEGATPGIKRFTQLISAQYNTL